MTFRVLVVAVGAACIAAVPARAQKAGSFEIGAFAAYLNADNSLPVGNALGFGGRVGVNALRYLSVEVDIASASKNGAKYRPLHVWLVYNVPPTSRAELFAAVRYVKNSYTGSYKANDRGVGGPVGGRPRVGQMLARPPDGPCDFITSPANKSHPI